MAQASPPFQIPVDMKRRQPGGWQVKYLQGSSDGDPSKWPKHPYRDSDNRNYIIRLAQEWAQDTGTAEPGLNYYLDQLPKGYKCFEVNQAGGPQVYKRLFGHPSGRFYDSIVRFYPHFLWLVKDRVGVCDCVLCGKRGTNKPIIPRPRQKLDAIGDLSIRERARPRHVRDDSSSRSDSVGFAAERRRRHAGQNTEILAVDEEGTEDVWRAGVKLLYRSRNANRPPEQDIREPNSIDWRANQVLLPQYMTVIDQQHSFIPRIGELVLWCPNWVDDHYLMKDPRDGCYKFYSFESKSFNGFPAWRGGIVAAVPSAEIQNGTLDFSDLLYTPRKKTAANTAAFRIETMPDPNNDMDKSMSKQYKYVHLAAIRPLSHWQFILKGIPQKRLHPSILYAMSCMTSLSLVDKWRINGEWPQGQIFARGIHLGSEFITIGDAVRLRRANFQGDNTSEAPRKVEDVSTDVLVVDSIRMHLIDCKPEHTELDSKLLSTKLSVSFVGSAYTTDQWRAYDAPSDRMQMESDVIIIPNPLEPEQVKTTFRAVGSDGYGSWFRMHAPSKCFEASYDQVLGRLYEADAVRLWTGKRQNTYTVASHKKIEAELDYDAASIMAGRRYASKTDERLPKIPLEDAQQICWVISDTRGQALSIATLNGIDLSAYHDIRTPLTLSTWRMHLKILDGQKPDEVLQSLLPRRTDGLLTGNEALEQMMSLGSSPSTSTGKRKGRPPGTTVIDGKLYFKNQLPAADGRVQPKRTSGEDSKPIELEEEDDDDDGEADHSEESENVLVSTTRTPARQSMRGAAFASTDDEESGEDDEDEEDEEDDENLYDTQAGPTIQETQMSEAIDSQDDEEMNYEVASRQKKGSGKMVAKSATKSQIMESTEILDYDEDEDVFDDGWDDPRNARGGTEESSGGDYEPA